MRTRARFVGDYWIAAVRLRCGLRRSWRIARLLKAIGDRHLPL